jgi:hypothetical protein
MLKPAQSNADQLAPDRRFREPVFIIGCNRSGTTLLFNNLSSHPDTWSLYIESQQQFHRHYPVHPELGERVSQAATPEVAEALRTALYRQSHNKEVFKAKPILQLVPRKLVQRPLGVLLKPRQIRLVEKTPANSLRIPLLFSLFPDARFIFLIRRGEDVVSSLMEGWKNWSRARTGPAWHYTKWHYLVPDGWQAYTNKPLHEICAFQWLRANLQAWEDLQQLPSGQVLQLRHEDLMSRPAEEYRRILEFCRLDQSDCFDQIITQIRARVFTTGGSQPRPEKWRDMHEREIIDIRPTLEPVNQLFYAGDQ